VFQYYETTFQSRLDRRDPHMFDSCSDFPELLQRVQRTMRDCRRRRSTLPAGWSSTQTTWRSCRREAGGIDGVAPATLTRFAKRFGFAGYDALRAVSQRRLRARAGAFAPEARRMVARRKLSGAEALAEGVYDAISTNIDTLRGNTSRAKLRKAAQLLSRARRIYVLGSRSSYPVAYHFFYIASFGGAPVSLVDGAGGIGVDAMRGAGAGDVMFAVSVAPYARATVEAAAHAAARRVGVIALTDSPLSPLAARARHAHGAYRDAVLFSFDERGLRACRDARRAGRC
jgi:hypothetical protein